MMNIASAAARYSPTDNAAITAMQMARSAEIFLSSSAEIALKKMRYPASTVMMAAVSTPRIVLK